MFRYIREALDLLAAMGPTLAQAIEVAVGRPTSSSTARIDRVGMASGRDRPYYSGNISGYSQLAVVAC